MLLLLTPEQSASVSNGRGGMAAAAGARCAPVLNARLRILDMSACAFYTPQLVPAVDSSTPAHAAASGALAGWPQGQPPHADHLCLSVQHSAVMLHKTGKGCMLLDRLFAVVLSCVYTRRRGSTCSSSDHTSIGGMLGQ
jgi:hypothetical protein